MNNHPTLKDVARAAGVSHMTVSRVVRGEHTVSPETIDKVNSAIKKVGYHPDPALSALASYRANLGARSRRSVIAFLDCDGSEHSRITLKGAQREAARFGYRVDHFPMDQEGGQAVISRMLYHRGIEGLLFGPSDSPRVFEGWMWEHFAPVSLGALYHQPAMHAVGMDYFHGLHTAHDALLAMGRKRIGLILNRYLEARTGHFWLGAYVSREEGIPPLMYTEKPSTEVIQRWVKEHRINGVLAINGAFHEQFERMGVMVGYLNDYHYVPDAPHISLDPATIGAEGIRVLHHLLLRREFGLPEQPKTVLLRGKWIPGGSRALSVT